MAMNQEEPKSCKSPVVTQLVLLLTRVQSSISIYHMTQCALFGSGPVQTGCIGRFFGKNIFCKLYIQTGLNVRKVEKYSVSETETVSSFIHAKDHENKSGPRSKTISFPSLPLVRNSETPKQFWFQISDTTLNLKVGFKVLPRASSTRRTIGSLRCKKGAAC
jgi:hypothetical protein